MKGGDPLQLYYHDCSGTASQDPGHTTRAPLMQTQPAVRVGFELATNYIQFYAFTN